MSIARTYRQIGKPVGRAEGPEKVSGEAKYPGDIRLPGMLVGKCLRSPYAYARIISVDVSAARDFPGVHTVICGADLPELRVGRYLRDFEPLAKEYVLFAGQKVAAVAADSNDIAQAALALIEVEYEELEPVFDPVDALDAGAPVLHPDFDTYSGRVEAERNHPNIVAQARWNRGDVAQGFAEADFVIEHSFRTQRQHQGYIEPHACVVNIEPNGHVQVWANSKAPFQLRSQIATGIGLDDLDVTVMASPIGGDFGGKGGFMDTHVAYWLAKTSGRPVRMTMDYTEELIAGNPRHGAVMTFKTGVMKDGTIVARKADLIYDSGAFGAFRPGKGATYGPRCLDPYKMNHAEITTTMVYTNLVPCGSMRSPGDPQSVFAGEAHIDLVAREIGMDPLAFRLHNLVREGDISPLGIRWRDPMAVQVLQAAAEAVGYATRQTKLPDGRLCGIGLSVCDRNTGGGNAAARVTVTKTGEVILNISLRDTGAGSYTMLRQVAAEELGVPYDAVRLDTWTTDDLDNDGAVGGARVTNAGGNAVLQAAQLVKQKLAGFITNKYGWPAEDIDYIDGDIRYGDQSMSLATVMADFGDVVVADCNYTAPAFDGTVFTAQAARVAVDEETGEVELLQFVTAHDVGTVLNPIAHQGQIEGGFVQGFGYAMMEEVRYEDGQVMNAHLGDYKLPTMRDMPKLTTIHVRSKADGPTPYGGKGIGEQSVSGVAPAIVNAVLDATGKSIRSLPVTAEKLLRILED